MNEESERWRADRARDYLENVRGLSRSLSSMQMEIEELRSKALPQGIVYTGMPGSPNSYGDAIPDAVIRLDALVRRYCDELASCIAEVENAHRLVESLPTSEQRDILRMKYILGYSWERVAVNVGYSRRTTIRRANRALCELFCMLPPEWRLEIPSAL